MYYHQNPGLGRSGFFILREYLQEGTEPSNQRNASGGTKRGKVD